MKSAVWLTLSMSVLCILSDNIHLYVNAAVATLEKQHTVTVGDTVTLPCHTKLLLSVDWQFHKSPFDYPTYVYSNDQVYADFKSRFNVTRPTSDNYSLTIIKSNLNDTGLYTCTEDGGNGPRHTVPLLVVTASETETPSNAPLVVLGIFVIILVIVVIILTVLLVYRLRYCHRVRKQQADEPGNDANESQVKMLPLMSNTAAEHDATSDAAEKKMAKDSDSSDGESSQHLSDDESKHSDNTKEISKPLPLPTSIKFTLSAVGADETKGKQVRGVCVHDNYLYVIRTPDPEIQIYDRLTMKKVRNLNESGERYAGCMALCPINKCFYITYFKSKLIVKLDMDGTQGKRWSVVSEPDGVSVTPSANVLVTFREAPKPTLKEFDSNGTESKTIVMESPVIKPRYAVSHVGNYLVCYGMSGSTPCGVCLVSKEGKVLQSIDSRTEHPLHLAVHSSGYVLVPDFNFKNVAMLDENLKYLREAVTDGLTQPFRLCFDDQFKHLYVGEFSGEGRVLAYDVAY